MPRITKKKVVKSRIVYGERLTAAEVNEAKEIVVYLDKIITFVKRRKNRGFIYGIIHDDFRYVHNIDRVLKSKGELMSFKTLRENVVRSLAKANNLNLT